MQSAQNILEIACGRCTLIPFALQLKSSEASYLAVDLAPVMIEKAHENLKNHLSLYESKLTYEEWLSKKKLTIKVANG